MSRIGSSLLLRFGVVFFNPFGVFAAQDVVDPVFVVEIPLNC